MRSHGGPSMQPFKHPRGKDLANQRGGLSTPVAGGVERPFHSTPLSRGVRGGLRGGWSPNGIRVRSTPLGMPSMPPPGHPSMHPSTTPPLPPSATPLAPPRENPLSHHVLRHGEEGGAKGGEGGHPKKCTFPPMTHLGGLRTPLTPPLKCSCYMEGGCEGGQNGVISKMCSRAGG